MAHSKLAILRRRLFTIVSILSLFLCLATLALWVRSYWRVDAISYHSYTDKAPITAPPDEAIRGLAAQSELGELAFMRQLEPPPQGSRTILGYEYYTGKARLALKHNENSRVLLGFVFNSYDDIRGGEFRAIAIPHWFLALLFAILPALYMRALLRWRKRNRAGLCPVCGYDLRATPERCPECGTAQQI